MNMVPMNKTNVVEYMLANRNISKIWNVSRLMRKRVKWIIEDKTVICLKYHENALKLNGWVQIGKTELQMENEIKRGISNYKAENQEDLNKIMQTNNSLKCSLKLEEYPGKVLLSHLYSATVTNSIFERYTDIACLKVCRLKLACMKTPEIKAICSKINSIDYLEIKNSTLNCLDLSLFKVKCLFLWRIEIEESLYLPSNLAYLRVRECSNLNLIGSKGITKLKLYSKDKLSKSDICWLKTLVGLKKIKMNNCLRQCIDFLPSSIRKIQDNTKYKKLDTLKLKSNLPYLLHINAAIPLSAIEALNLRKIGTETVFSFNLKLTVKPRKIAVKSSKMLKDFPELFEKVEEIEVFSEEVNLNLIPSGLKRLVLRDKCAKSR